MPSRIRRASVAAGVCLTTLVLAPVVASASGGGGCGGPVTDHGGTRVEISGYCFTPTVLRVSPGDVVAFANMDPVPHSILGANATWGDYDGFKHKEVTYRFAEPGVFPYVCTYHVGMMGVVVVGDGVGGAVENSTADGPVVKADPGDIDLRSARTVRAPDASGETSWWLVAAAGALLVGASAIVARRRRRRGPADEEPGRP